MFTDFNQIAQIHYGQREIEKSLIYLAEVKTLVNYDEKR